VGTRILLADDHAVMREGLARLLGQEADFEVVGEASDGQDAVLKAGALRPDVILMDISMPVLTGIEATRIIHRHYPGIRIIGLSLYSEEERAREMLEAGAAYYMTKSGPATDLKAAIRACMQDRAPAVALLRRRMVS
jgi:DNA-binding NarL/FixJ family response regulator